MVAPEPKENCALKNDANCDGVPEGVEAALSEEPRPGAERKLSSKEEALLIATACSAPPAGHTRWTLDLLAGEMVRLTPHRSLSSETIRRRLAENELKPWLRKMWCIPKVDAEYVARMEDHAVPLGVRPDECSDERRRRSTASSITP